MYSLASHSACVDYAELHCLSNFSFQRGASHPEEFVVRAVELGYSALAITDECSFAGLELAANAEKRLHQRTTLAQRYPPTLLAATLEVAALCTFNLDELRY